MIMVMKLDVAIIRRWGRPRGRFRLNRNMIVSHCMMWRFCDWRWSMSMVAVIRRWSRCWIWPWIVTWRIVRLRWGMRLWMIIWSWRNWSIRRCCSDMGRRVWRCRWSYWRSWMMKSSWLKWSWSSYLLVENWRRCHRMCTQMCKHCWILLGYYSVLCHTRHKLGSTYTNAGYVGWPQSWHNSWTHAGYDGCSHRSHGCNWSNIIIS